MKPQIFSLLAAFLYGHAADVARHGVVTEPKTEQATPDILSDSPDVDATCESDSDGLCDAETATSPVKSLMDPAFSDEQDSLEESAEKPDEVLASEEGTTADPDAAYGAMLNQLLSAFRPTQYPTTELCQKKFDVEPLTQSANVIAAGLVSKVQFNPDLRDCLPSELQLIQSTLQGSYRHGHINQDALVSYCVRDVPRLGNVLVLGVFDGHGADGHHISSYAVNSLGPLLEEFKTQDKDYTITTFINSALIELQDRIRKDKAAERAVMEATLGGNMSLGLDPEENGGSTALLVGVANINGKNLVIGLASLGDSMANLYSMYSHTSGVADGDMVHHDNQIHSDRDSLRSCPRRM
eukprot:Blabericola_migrator_1__10854@NODE_624_length_7189_cov_211_722269_g455_i0_p2_GENE_NODE_624_length_7189_cov_211_722269_g455_i0NODE_624_length_7189_cov_211_722269_g455_i0_p2_ORF_typecomplete_len353_score46_54PP2C/PF00481_21/8_2e02PP2C/PF00481_21/1_9e08_NODE_624_length_7189_cov_211_722269_g455_i042345292